MFKKILIVLLSLNILLQPFYALPVFADETAEVSPTPTPTPTPIPVTEVATGEAAAQTENSSEVNTNVVAGELTINEYNLSGTESAQINLVPQISTESADIKIDLENNAEVSSTASAVANTGGNSIETASGEAKIDTGDAGGFSDNTNIVNTNVILSQVEIDLFNIIASYSGSLIFPRMELWHDGLIPLLDFQRLNIQNIADVQTQTTALANTGGNLTEGSDKSSIVTGDAVADTVDTAVVNTNILSQVLFRLQINNFAGWSGKVYNWSKPGSVEDFSRDLISYLETCSTLTSSSVATVSGDIKNEAKVETYSTAMANTGNNEIKNETGSSQIETGNAVAFAKTLNIVNTNIIGSRVYLGFVNIFSYWNGDIIFAYPDLSLSITPSNPSIYTGDTVNFTVNYKNNGYDTAENSKLLLDLPNGPEEVPLGNLASNQTGSYNFSYQFNDPGNFEILARVETSDAETDLGNNSGSSFITVNSRVGGSSTKSGDSNNKPVLSLSGWNNTGKYVNPGDSVIFEYQVKNEGNDTCHDAYLTQRMRNGEDLGELRFGLGSIAPGRTAKLTFNFKLHDKVTPGVYTTWATARCEVDSNEVITKFTVSDLGQIAGISGYMGDVLSEMDLAPKVLASEDFSCIPEIINRFDIIPWVLLFFVTAFYVLEKIKRLKNYVQFDKKTVAVLTALTLVATGLNLWSLYVILKHFGLPLP